MSVPDFFTPLPRGRSPRYRPSSKLSTEKPPGSRAFSLPSVLGWLRRLHLPGTIVVGDCYVCRELFGYKPRLVPRLPANGHGGEPVCRSCARLAGLPLPPGAYAEAEPP